jgi:hypothetical protein
MTDAGSGSQSGDWLSPQSLSFIRDSRARALCWQSPRDVFEPGRADLGAPWAFELSQFLAQSPSVSFRCGLEPWGERRLADTRRAVALHFHIFGWLVATFVLLLGFIDRRGLGSAPPFAGFVPVFDTTIYVQLGAQFAVLLLSSATCNPEIKTNINVMKAGLNPKFGPEGWFGRYY